MLSLPLILLCVFAMPGFLMGGFAPLWGGLLAAECFLLVSLGFIYVVGGSVLHDELSLWRFLGFLTTWPHAIALAILSVPILAWHLARRWVWAREAASSGGAD
jgi:hypothetical protein